MTVTIDSSASIATTLALVTGAIRRLGGRLPDPASTAGDTITQMIAYAQSLGQQGRPVPVVRIPEIKTVNNSSRPAYLPPSSFYKLGQQVLADPNEMPPMPMMTHMAVKSGSWTDPTVWDTGTVPTRDSVTMPVVMIGNGKSILYDEYSSKPIYGVMGMGSSLFQKDTSKPTREIVYTNMFMGGYVCGKKGDPVTRQNPHETLFHGIPGLPGAAANMGQMFSGTSSHLGEAKATKLFTYLPIPAGTTSIPLAYLPTANWQVGDLIAIAGRGYAGSTATDPTSTAPTYAYFNAGAYGIEGSTGYALLHANAGFVQSQDEARYITAISGGAVQFTDPLQFDHLIYSTTLPSGDVVKVPNVVSNFTRSIKRRTLGRVSGDSAFWSGADLSNPQKRAMGDMFMGGDYRHDQRYVEFIEMGRTLDDVTLVATGQPGALCDASIINNPGADIANPSNVRGRYGGSHCHILGWYNIRPQARIIGCSARGELFGVADTQAQRMARQPIPGKVFVHHLSNAAFEDNVTLNSRGPAWMSEVGSEIGQHLGGVYMSIRGDAYPDGYGGRQENVTNHQGHEGVGCESQSRQLLQQHNYISGTRKAFNYLQQVTNHLNRVKDRYSLRYAHPLVGGKGISPDSPDPALGETYGIKQDMILAFDFNVCAGVDISMFRAQVEFIDRSDNTNFNSRGFVCVNSKQLFDYDNYTQQYFMSDFFAHGVRDLGIGSVAIRLGNVQWGNSFNNGSFKNFDQEFDNVAAGFNMGGRNIDLISDVGAVRGVDWIKTVDLTAHPLASLPDRDIDGPWIDNQDGTITIKKFHVFSSATDLPVPYPGGNTSPPWGLKGVEPSPGTTKPYFVLDGSSTLVFDPTNGTVPSVSGIVVDSAGVSRWPFNFSSESFDPVTASNPGGPNPTPSAGTSSVMTLLKTNGVYKDVSGNLKCRMWFTVRDRGTKKEFVWYVDADVHNVSDADIAANGLLLPNANDQKPTTDLAAEDVTLQDFAFPPPAPPISWFTGSTFSVAAKQTLYVPLLVSLVAPVLTLKPGLDAAKFELFSVSGVPYLRWTGNTTRLYSAPTDANSDNVYEALIGVTDQFGNAGPDLHISVTVYAKQEAVQTYFLNSALPYTSNLQSFDTMPQWTRISSVPNALLAYTYDNPAFWRCFGLGAQGGSGEPILYMGPDTGSPAHYATVHIAFEDGNAGSGYVAKVVCAVCISDEDNYIRAFWDYHGGYGIVSRKGGVETSQSYGTEGTAQTETTMRLEYTASTRTAVLKRGSETLITWVIPNPPPATTRAGFYGGGFKDTSYCAYDLETGAL